MCVFVELKKNGKIGPLGFY